MNGTRAKNVWPRFISILPCLPAQQHTLHPLLCASIHDEKLYVGPQRTACQSSVFLTEARHYSIWQLLCGLDLRGEFKTNVFVELLSPPNRQTRHRTRVQLTKPVCQTWRSLTSTMPRNRKIMASDVELQAIYSMGAHEKHRWNRYLSPRHSTQVLPFVRQYCRGLSCCCFHSYIFFKSQARI